MLTLTPEKQRHAHVARHQHARHDEPPVLIELQADILEDGQFGTMFMQVTEAYVRVRDQNFRPVLHLGMEEIASARHEPVHGGGQLVVTTHSGAAVTVVRYTQSCQSNFAEAARGIEQLARGEKLQIHLKHESLRCQHCGRLLPERDGVCPACVKPWETVKRMVAYLKPYQAQAATLAMLSVVSTVITLLIPMVQGRLIDQVFSRQQPINMLYTLMAAWLGMFLISIAIQIGNGKLIVYLASHISADMRSQLYRSIEYLQLSFVDKKQVGALTSRVSQESNNIWGFLAEGLPFLLTNTMMCVGVIGLLFYVNWFLTLWILLPVPLVLFLSLGFWKQMRQRWYKAGNKWARLNQALQESVSGLRVIKVFAQEERDIRRFETRNLDLRDTCVQTDSYWHNVWGVVSLALGFGLLMTWAAGGWLVVHDELSLGDFWKMIAYMGMVYGPINWFANFNNWFSRATASAQRIFEITDRTPEPRHTEKPSRKIEGRITFEGVHFAYDKANPIIRDLSFDVGPGEMIGLVGRSGSGKSTTMNLLCGFYQPDAGEIRIDGVPLSELNLADFRSQIGVVLQDPFLFDGTIAENIAYGKPNATMEEIMAAARAANAHTFIMNKPDGYDTAVGERGGKLSGGERQRISIARAILHNPRILILDEATSSVDVETEKQIQEALVNLTRGRTTFAIAHRLSTLRNADRLIVMDRGQMVEMGTHAELLDRDGTFASLVRTQGEVNQILAAAV